jgi:hypothetical protein
MMLMSLDSKPFLYLQCVFSCCTVRNCLPTIHVVIAVLLMQESTLLTAIANFVHQGMIFVPAGELTVLEFAAMHMVICIGTGGIGDCCLTDMKRVDNTRMCVVVCCVLKHLQLPALRRCQQQYNVGFDNQHHDHQHLVDMSVLLQVTATLACST